MSQAIIRLGAYQGPSEAGAIDKNAATALRALGEAHRRGVDFACLPECHLSGYGTSDLLRAGAISVQSQWFRQFLRRCAAFGQMVSIVGLVERRGGRLHNSAAVIQGGKLLGVYRKSIPGSKHEEKIVTYVSRFPVFRAHGVTFGVIICVEGSVPEPCMILAGKGARIIFEPHFAFPLPQLMNAQRVRIRSSRIARAVENQVWMVRANAITPPDHRIDDEPGIGYGDSLIVDPLGVPRAEAGLFTTGWITADVPRKELTAKRPSRVKFVPKATREQMARLYK